MKKFCIFCITLSICILSCFIFFGCSVGIQDIKHIQYKDSSGTHYVSSQYGYKITYISFCEDDGGSDAFSILPVLYKIENPNYPLYYSSSHDLSRSYYTYLNECYYEGIPVVRHLEMRPNSRPYERFYSEEFDCYGYLYLEFKMVESRNPSISVSNGYTTIYDAFGKKVATVPAANVEIVYN